MSVTFIHPTATVESPQDLGPGCRVWHYAHIRQGAVVGAECIIGKGAYVDAGVVIGARAKLQNSCSVYRGSHLANGVFIGPGSVLTNDRYPRAIGPDGALKTDDDWEVEEIVVGEGASIGAMAVVVAGLRLGDWSMLGAGSVATRDLPPHGLAYGNPAHLAGFICKCGRARTESLELLKCGCMAS